MECAFQDEFYLGLPVNFNASERVRGESLVAMN